MYYLHSISKRYTRIAAFTVIFCMIFGMILSTGVQPVHAQASYLMSQSRPVYISTVNGESRGSRAVDGDMNFSRESSFISGLRWITLIWAPLLP